MAWSETCKIDANKQVDHLHKQGLSKRQAIKKLSNESGIPYDTLNNWVYPRKSDVKNNVTLKPDTPSETKPNGADPENNEVKNKNQPSQEDIWFNVGMKLKQLDAYMRKNCKNSAEISNGLKEAVDLYISKIQVFYLNLK